MYRIIAAAGRWWQPSPAGFRREPAPSERTRPGPRLRAGRPHNFPGRPGHGNAGSSARV